MPTKKLIKAFVKFLLIAILYLVLKFPSKCLAQENYITLPLINLSTLPLINLSEGTVPSFLEASSFPSLLETPSLPSTEELFFFSPPSLRLTLPKPISVPSFDFFNTLSRFFVNFIVNAFFLVLGYLFLKKVTLIKSWRFLRYIFFVTLGEALINLISLALLNLGCGYTIVLFFFRLDFLVICVPPIWFYNYWLSRRFFNLSRKQAFFIGLIMSVLNFILLPFKIISDFLVHILCWELTDLIENILKINL